MRAHELPLQLDFLLLTEDYTLVKLFILNLLFQSFSSFAFKKNSVGMMEQAKQVMPRAEERKPDGMHEEKRLRYSCLCAISRGFGT